MENQEAKDIVEVICKRLCKKDGEAPYYLSISMRKERAEDLLNIAIIPTVDQGLWKYKMTHCDERSHHGDFCHIDFQDFKIKYKDQVNTTTMHDMSSVVDFIVLNFKQVALAIGDRDVKRVSIQIRKNIVCNIRKIQDMCIADQAKDDSDPTKKGWANVGMAVNDQVSTAAPDFTVSISINKSMQVDTLRECLKSNLEILMVMCKDHHNAWIMSK